MSERCGTSGAEKETCASEYTNMYMVSTCFRVGAGHDAQKARMRLGRPRSDCAATTGAASSLCDTLLLRQQRTGCMLKVAWTGPTDLHQAKDSATDRAKFVLALAQAAPNLCCLGGSKVTAMLRAVERHRGGGDTAATWSPAAAAVWARMQSQHSALCHGDFHPGANELKVD
jgi:hypothetical protein|eukprot:COSAG06_NODE_1041_length_10982_cov_6.205366_4_plen_172_part_00